MGSTFLSLHFLVTFSTKERRPWSHPAWITRLHEYLGGTIRGLGGVPEAVGGVADHVHLLMGLRATHALADVIREVKKAATTWVHDEKLESAFCWQEGYAAYTVSPNVRHHVRRYIGNQAEHHRRVGYHDELVMLLEKAGIEYDPRYLE